MKFQVNLENYRRLEAVHDACDVNPANTDPGDLSIDYSDCDTCQVARMMNLLNEAHDEIMDRNLSNHFPIPEEGIK